MITEVTFDTMNGIDLKGWWSNPSTGESYEIVDQFFQDNALYAKTSQGQIINFNRIQNFVHSDSPITHPIEQTAAQLDREQLLAGLDPDSAEEVEDLLHKPINSTKSAPVQSNQVVKNVDEQILEKAFSKAPVPEVKLTVDWSWKNLTNTLSMLVETMELSKESISEYICNKFMSEIQNDIKKQISELIDSKLNN